ncbi:MAG: replicative DNA helicase [Candidatus Lloydbacteria bacterium CG22_combo_CG10-13_8_21_14_all_47_15]|uniref:Replicative DNA helicase n=1 Tax=Candidatus Lloydbacteria bacterium CG22_combo_CG10-13_8_21_14_all_47_15 TaxID=1974635 RepID=A0A2H0CTD4_9BACT|nr:MAG: replicative DNA helicase [Candidatus Lloydbacteria bacterium CG22_combo_CG10-13_8_21_14_all_47_15]
MADQSLRVPPQSIDSEKALLGAVMLRPTAINEVIDFVTPDAFYADKHRLIFEAMLELLNRSEPIDLLSLSARLKDKNTLDKIGGNVYLSEILNSVPSSTNVGHYANIVRRKYILRALIDAADHIAKLGYNEEQEIDQTLDEAEKRVFEITGRGTTHKFISIKDTLGDAWDRLDHLHNSKDEIRGVRTGFKGIDDKLAGFQKSDLIILAARPSVGKTSLALDIARQAATKHNIPVGIFSLEMSAQQLVDRMLAAEAKVDSWKLRTGKISGDSEFQLLRDALDRLSTAPIYIDDQAQTNVLRMRSVARRLKSEHGLGLIVVDYLQLMMPNTGRASDSMVQQVTEISRSLKALARELDVPVLALSQLSRAVEQRGGKPRLSDLRDSGSIEQDADVVMFIHRDKNAEGGRENIAEILIEKHRNGPTGKVELYFDEQKTTFLPVEKSTFGEF